jgi:endonuclease YncB( thermonuclease family)
VNKYSICVFLLSLAASVWAENWQGTCVGVIDGDSLVVKHASEKKEVRLYGIDAPEFNQAYGRQARKCLSALVLKKEVQVEPVTTDRYGRTVAKVHTRDGCVNEQLIAQGCAWIYTRFCGPDEVKAWSSLEQNARQQGLGLWSRPDPVAPWNFRQKKRPAKQGEQHQHGMASGYYRGNTSSLVFHAPGCDYATCKHCTAGFNSIGSAMRAGYRPCKKCIDR